MNKAMILRILNVVFILFLILTAFQIITGGWGPAWELINAALIVGLWELIRWVQRPDWDRCPHEGCTFKTRINHQEISDEVMLKHREDAHGYWS